MAALKVADKMNNIQWDYDSDGDVLNISIGSPGNAEGVDIGDGMIARISGHEVVGITIMNFSQRTLKGIVDK
jgi:uncharacterized protein YuzE